MVTIIVAYSKDNRIIGNCGTIPWKLPEDINFFKETTINNSVVMGRKTWESIPEKYRPLKYRMNFILSHDQTFAFNTGNILHGIFVSSDIDGIIKENCRRFPDKELFVIGGEQIYEEFLNRGIVDKIIASEVKKSYNGDRYFPSLKGPWKSEVMKEFKEFKVIEYNKEA